MPCSISVSLIAIVALSFQKVFIVLQFDDNQAEQPLEIVISNLIDCGRRAPAGYSPRIRRKLAGHSPITRL